MTWDEYAASLEANIGDLHRRVTRGGYRAKPSRRQYIPKPDGRQRPLGIAALEDKVVQRALVEVLNAIYETDFLGFSYGFRPGRCQHDALDALAYGINLRQVNWILDADIRSFFDRISHAWMMRFLEHRIGDRRVLRLVAKWLKAGVMEEGAWTEGVEGTPQGAVISPLLANIYLHYVYDLWVDQWRRRRATGEVIVIRYADDTVVGFQRHADAERFLRELRERLATFGLELHPEKTRLIEFGRFAAQRRSVKGSGSRRPSTSWASRTSAGSTRTGRFILLRHTIAERMRAKLLEIKETLYRMCHLPVPEQGRWLGQVVRGYFAYHAVPTNSRRDQRPSTTTSVWHWLRALARRSQKAAVPWRRMKPDRRALAAARQGPTPLAATTLPRPRPEVGAECVSSARSDLSGGRGVIRVPTGMRAGRPVDGSECKSSHVEGVAAHDGPESCGVTCEGGGEALTGETAGWVLSREMLKVQGADAVEKSGRPHDARRHGEARVGPARSETPRTRGHHPHGNREIPGLPGTVSPGRGGKASAALR